MDKLAAVTGLTAILAIPEEIASLRSEVAELKEMLQALQRSIPPMVVKTSEAAAKLGLTQKSIRRLLKEGKLKSVRVGGQSRIDLASVNQALALRAEDLSST